MSNEKLTPERSVRLLRAKAAELESQVQQKVDANYCLSREDFLAADIALVAGLLADHMEDLLDSGDLSPDIDDANVRDMRDWGAGG